MTRPEFAGRYAPEVAHTTRSVLDAPGHTSSALRWAAFHRRMEELPVDLREYVGKVATQAWNVTDADVEALVRAGHSEDAIFEVTAAAALGAAIARLEKGLNVLHHSRA